MKILQVNCVYKKGSTGKITYDLHKGLLDAGIDSVVCYGRGKDILENNVYRICTEKNAKINHLISKVTGVMYGGCGISTRRLISVIEDEQPDVVHLQCINGYFVSIYKLLAFLNKRNIPTVITLHAEFMYTGGCGYSLDCEKWKDDPGCGGCPIWKIETGSLFRDKTKMMWMKMRDSFVGFNNLTVVSVSPWLMKRAKESPFLKEKQHCVIYNGLDTTVFNKYEHPQNNQKVVFHASPYFSDEPNHMKGGYYVLELAKRMPEVQFVVAGDYTVKGKIPENVEMLGRISNQEALAKLYSKADLTLLTSKRETFSMICAESLCCGTPVIGFRAGAPEQIALAEYSEFVDYGDLGSLEMTVRKWLAIEKNERISDVAKSRFSKSIMTQQYMEVYKKMISGG